MSNIICPVCGSKIHAESHIREHDSPISKKEYKLYHCSECDLSFWFPRKLEKGLYEEDAFELYLALHKNLKGKSEQLKWIRKNLPLRSGRLLDVGCGNGAFLRDAKGLGFEVYGIDFDKESIKAAKSQGLKNVFIMSLEEFVKYSNERDFRFDVVTFFEVLEHQSDPKQFINDVKSVLKPGGVVIGTVPNRERALANLDRKGLLGDYPPHHFLWWSKRSLRNYYLANDFEGIEFFPAGRWRLGYISAWWEARLFGKVTKNLKRRIKETLIGDKELAKLDISYIGRIESQRKAPVLVVKFFQLIRGIIFLPLSLSTFWFFRIRPQKIYFQAKYKK